MRTNGTWRDKQSIGTGSFSLIGKDLADGNLSDDRLEAVNLTGVGYEGNATYTLSVNMLAKERGLPILDFGLYAGGDITFSATDIAGDAPIGTNGSTAATSAFIAPAVHAAGTTQGSSYLGGTNPGADAQTMPTATDVFQTYISMGTVLDNAGMDAGGTLELRELVLTPTYNPIGGGTNADGIYVIGCAGQELRIRDVRIEATIVALDCASTSLIDSNVSWFAPGERYPALLVRGSINLEILKGALSESALGVNFNPTGAPSEGVTDTDTEDSYTGGIHGLVYVRDALSTRNHPAVEGTIVVGGNANLSDSLTLTHDPSYATAPPPEFEDEPLMYLEPGSWRRVVQ